MPHTRPGERASLVGALRQISSDIGKLKQPRNPAWLYPIPFAPATEPVDYISGFDAYPSFEGAWLNIGDPFPPTAFRLFEGKPQIRLYCTGDETTPSSLIFTLPVGWRPKHSHPLDVVVGADLLRRGTVLVEANGNVTWIGLVS